MDLKRNIFNKLLDEMTEPQTSILLGPRQVGKTTLLKKLARAAKRRKKRVAFFNLELPHDLEKLTQSEKALLSYLDQAGDVIFIDEFHYLPNASKILKGLYDGPYRCKVYVSGSSSPEIHRHLKESLAGRFKKTQIFPLSFKELGNRKVGLGDYLLWGGMPGLLHQAKTEQKIELLDNLLSTYLLRDVKSLIREENVRAFNHLLYCLAQTQGSLGNVANLSRELGVNHGTLSRYLEILEQTYTLYKVQSFSTNLANELKKSSKYYLFDLGVRNALLKDFSSPKTRQDHGALLETFVLHHLVMQRKANMEIRFWRTKKGDEVDFVLLKNRVPVPVEVKTKWEQGKIPKGIQKFLRHYPQAPFAIIYSENIKGKKKYLDKEVLFQPIHTIVQVDYFKEVL